MESAVPASVKDRPHLLMCGPYPAADTQALEATYTVHKLWEHVGAALPPEQAAQVRAIATRGDLGASATLIGQLPALEIISCYGVGTDAIDLAAARARGIQVTNTPDVLTGDVADLAVGLALAAMRRIPAGDAYVRSGAWSKQAMGLVTRLHGKRVGVVGLGRIGQAVARRLAGFDVELAYFARAARPDCAHRYFSSVTELARWSDLLVVTLAGGPSTKDIINAEVLNALGEQGWLVNVSRGSTVDEPALLLALEQGRIAGAGLDVFWNEPQIDPRFLALHNVVLQPHHASATAETRQAMGQLVRDNLSAHFAGQALLTPVD